MIPSGYLKHNVSVINPSVGQIGDGDQYFSYASTTTDIKCLLITMSEEEQIAVFGEFRQTRLKLMYLPSATVSQNARVIIPTAFANYGANAVFKVIRGQQNFQFEYTSDYFADSIIELQI